MVTSIYLANNTIRAVQGSRGKSIRIKRVCQTQIPEGSLINGIITNEAELTAQLKEFWAANRLPKKNVELVIGSTQFVLKNLEVPQISDRKLREQLPLEFTDVTGMTDPVLDYMADKNEQKRLSVQAVMVEKGFIQGYLQMFKEMGISVNGISVARIDLSKSLAFLKQLQDQTAIILSIDGTTIASNLWSNGDSVYSTQKRVFSDPGTQQFVTEIARVISNILQFASAQHMRDEIHRVYLSGINKEEFEQYQQGIADLAMGVSVEKLEPEKQIRMDKNIDCHFSMILPEIGSMIKTENDINLAAAIRRKTKTRGKETSAWKRYVILPCVLLAAGAVCVGGLYVMLRNRTNTLRELEKYLEDPVNLEQNDQADYVTAQNTELMKRNDCIQKMNDILDSYPHMNSQVVAQLVVYAAAKTVELEVQSYDSSTGMLNVDAQAVQVTLINQFIDTLEASGIFDDIYYTGYTYDEENTLYTINVGCYLAENAGK